MQNWLKNSKMALKLVKKYHICPQNTKNEGNINCFLFFFLLGTLDKNAAICRTIGGHIQTQLSDVTRTRFPSVATPEIWRKTKPGFDEIPVENHFPYKIQPKNSR